MLNVIQLTGEQFALSRDRWSELLSASAGDQAFQSWEWQHCWWQTYRSALQASLALTVVVDSAGVWHGLAPLYVAKNRYFGLVPSRILQPIGNAWRSGATIVSEYTDLVVRNGKHAEAVRALLLDAIFKDPGWDELVFSYLRNSSPTVTEIFDRKRRHNCIVYAGEEKTAYRISLSRDIAEYKAGLSANARRSMFANRSRFCRSGPPKYTLIRPTSLREYMGTLGNLQKHRFGEAVLGKTTIGFFESLAGVENSGIDIYLSTIRCGDTVVSMTLDIASTDVVYNLQSGFEHGGRHRVSLGLIHMGMNIEAYARRGYRVYDLLAGGGRSNPTYKARFCDSTIDLVSLRAIRGGLQKQLYKIRRAF